MKSSFLPKYEQKNVRISALCSEGRNLDNFSFVFWEKRWLHKFILKLTDLYKPCSPDDKLVKLITKNFDWAVLSSKNLMYYFRWEEPWIWFFQLPEIAVFKQPCLGKDKKAGPKISLVWITEHSKWHLCRYDSGSNLVVYSEISIQCTDVWLQSNYS